MNEEQLAAAFGCPHDRAVAWAGVLTEAMSACGIDTLARQAAFLAQIGHESGRLQYVRELWGPTPAQRGYEGRTDLGNTQPGDGRRYAGRGPMQCTGRKNYALARDRMRLIWPDTPDFEAEPERLEEPLWGARHAAWFWIEGAGLNLGRAAHAHGIPDGCNLNDLADREDFYGITLAINGGLTGLADRMALFERAKDVFASA